jgi:hypothetical protein
MSTLPQRIPLTLEKRVSVLDKLVLSEEVDFNCLDALIKSELLQDKYDLTNYSQKVASQLYSNEKQQLEQYKKKYDKKSNVFKVQYKKPRHGYGRVFPDKSLGLTCLSKKVRNTLIKGNYCDIDLSNAQPAIVYNICKSNNIPCELITKYIFDRETILQGVIDAYGVSRNDAKCLFIRLAFFGTFYGWKEELCLGDVYPINFIIGFQKELQSIAEIIKRSNPIMYECCRKLKSDKNEGNVIGSFFSLYLQEYETRIMECCYLYLKDKTQIIKKNILTYEYDGFKLLKSRVEEFGGVCQLITELNQVVLEQTGFVILFEEKTIEKCFEIEYTPFSPLQTTPILTREEIFEQTVNQYKQDYNNFDTAENDNEASLIILERIKDIIFYYKGKYFLKLEHTWSCDKNYIDNYLFNFILNSEIYRECDMSIVSYAQNKSSAKNIQECLYAKIMINKEAENKYKKFHTTTRNRICFKDGVLDFKEQKFYLWEEVDFEYYTTIMINRDFSNYFNNPDLIVIDEIKEKIFSNMYGVDAELALQFLSRGISGNYEDKNFLTYIGNRNCGKGVQYELLKTGLEDYVNTFELGNMLYCKKTAGLENVDCSKKLYWLMDLEFVRLAISQEVPDPKSGLKVNGKLWKKSCGGGDTIVARRNYDRFDSHFTIDATFAVYGNNSLEFDNDDCWEHALKLNSVKQFKTAEEIQKYKENGMDEIELSRYKVKDTSIKTNCSTDAWANAVVYLLFKNYTHNPITIKTDEDYDNNTTLITKIKEKYEFTNNKEDIILCNELYTRLDEDKGKIDIELKAFNVFKKKCNKNINRNKMCFFGLKQIIIEEIKE